MIKAKIKYVGKESGMLARFYSEPQLFGKFETEEELQEHYNKWVKISNSRDWKLIID